MSELKNKSDEPNAVVPQRNQFGVRYFVGLPLMILGIVVSVMWTVSHLEHPPPEPIDFDMTLRHGDGGFIVYGVFVTVLGFILMLFGVRRRTGA